MLIPGKVTERIQAEFSKAGLAPPENKVLSLIKNIIDSVMDSTSGKAKNSRSFFHKQISITKKEMKKLENQKYHNPEYHREYYARNRERMLGRAKKVWADMSQEERGLHLKKRKLKLDQKKNSQQ